jgi:hypothetical protein
MVGELVDHVRALSTWEQTLLVVTSDHGTNLMPPDIGRMKVTDANREEVYRVPLFSKAPGQVTGEIRDDGAQTIDVLPSIIDLLDADVDWAFDGHSLYDGSAAKLEPLVSGAPSAYRASFEQQELFADLPTSDGKLPFVLAGRVRGGAGEEPPELLAAVNGTLACTRSRATGRPRPCTRSERPAQVGSQRYRVRVPPGRVSCRRTVKRRARACSQVATE